MNIFTTLLMLAGASFSAFASDDSVVLDQMYTPSFQPRARIRNLSPAEMYRRTQLVFNHFQVQPELNYQPDLNGTTFTTSASFFPTLLGYMDPDQQFNRFFTQTTTGLVSYKDRDSKQVREYQLNYTNRRRRLSLDGLRVALDPGHMGGDLWDERTGKFVRLGIVKLSEGLIATQVALLVEQQLQAQGAEVMITRRTLGGVTAVPYEQLDINKYARRELRGRSLEPWFQNLVDSTAEADLMTAFDRSSNVRNLFSERMRLDYFSIREDLFARDEKIKAFRPDITIVIHFDASVNTPAPVFRNKTFAYVPGSFSETEFASGEMRAHLMQHLAKGDQWQRSVDLSTALVNQISTRLQVPLAGSDGHAESTKIADGVFARSLVLARLNTYSPIAYLECLYYGNLDEFNRLSRTDGGTLTIGGRAYPYSRRLADLATAIVKGIENYTATH